MAATVFITLRGKLAGKHPTLGILIDEDGHIKTKNKWRDGTLSSGYLRVHLQTGNYLVHRLVAETFLDNPYNKTQVDHINRISTDNRVKNLRFCTPSENCRNRSSYDNAINLGVRKHENPLEWDRRYKRYTRDSGLVKPLTQAQKEKKARADHIRNSNPLVKARNNELRRIRRAKKKAEQSAQPS